MPEQDNQNIVIQVKLNIANYKIIATRELREIMRFVATNPSGLWDSLSQVSKSRGYEGFTSKLLRITGYIKNDTFSPLFLKLIAETALEVNLTSFSLLFLNRSQSPAESQVFLDKVADKILQSFADLRQEEPLHLGALI